jgi:hypothetical protein
MGVKYSGRERKIRQRVCETERHTDGERECTTNWIGIERGWEKLG